MADTLLVYCTKVSQSLAHLSATDDTNVCWIIQTFPVGTVLAAKDLDENRSSIVKDISAAGLIEIGENKWGINGPTPLNPLVATNVGDHVIPDPEE